MKTIWHGFNHTDINLEADIIQEPEFYCLYCRDIDADELFAVMKCKDLKTLQIQAARFLELDVV